MSTISEYVTALNAVTLNGNLERDPRQRAIHRDWKDEEVRLQAAADAIHERLVQESKALPPEARKARRAEIAQAMAQVIDASAPNSPYPLFKA